MSKNNSKNKRHLSAEGYSLLPSALRPRLLGLLGIVAVSTILGYFYSTPVSAASLTLTVPNSFSLDIAPSSGGAFVKSEVKGLNIKTDNEYGYTLSVKAKNSDNSNVLLNGDNKLNSILESTTEDNFKSNSKFNNSWGYLPSKFNSEDNTNFLPGPTTEESVLETTDEANETGADYNIILGAKVDNNTIAGTYNNNFVFSVTTNEPKWNAIMQDWPGCASLPDDGNTTINLLDTRDNNIYKVAKLKDGKCWMVENLRLGDEKLTNRTLTLENTDISDPTYQLTEQTPVDFNRTNNGVYDADALYIDPNHPEYGGYYSWHTATAGTGTASMSTDGQNATSSICPKGWKLPTGGSSGDFKNLITAYGSNSTGSTNFRATPVPGFVYSGYVWNDGDGLTNQGSNGRYWSSTVNNANNAYYLNLTSSSVTPTSYANKYRGLSVRCVSETKTMQTVVQWGLDVEEDEVVEAVDTRDGNTYTVSRLKDGKLWMTQNLRLGDDKIKTRELTPDDTDIYENFTLPESDQDKANYPDSAGAGVPRLYLTNNDSYGNYYNWYAATAGSGWRGQASGDAPSSICPKGWRLPTQSEIDTLTTKYTYTTAPQSPANFVYSGLCRSSICPDVQGSHGNWWTSTTYSERAPYHLHLYAGYSFNVLAERGKGVGFSVRCIHTTEKITDLQYLQDWNNLSDEEKTQVKNSMQDETNYTLKDKRDDNEYTIAKLKDGKVWMTQNLKIAGVSISSSDSDMTSGSLSIPFYSGVSGFGGDRDNVDKNKAYVDSYGGLYTWYTATAGTGSSSITSSGVNATGSICPKGWKLPTSDSSSSGDFAGLVTAYGGNNPTGNAALRATPVPGFTYAGYIGYAGTGDVSPYPVMSFKGSEGCYWSSTSSGSSSARNLDLVNYSNPVANPAAGHERVGGLSVRCMAR